ncbi:DNA replication/repair protein RecF [Amphritea balenae]|uniref:DNA replication and repair protein RecF n=1 Tax=Amphritea balenae TaxID=452629 RepID=A0A3P1SNW5_9GAMM|nr:DNA replication/repair protein RecF [Amphritea balenae]RRC98848.1 DNA replication/repair protein RecF [Amphritea balenae]GGK62277.1 DNA replication and repair protein RecF [Amphritea balenae]
MPISQLSVKAIRNLTELSLSPSPQINIIHGINGSGKSSLLEAIHMLGLCRSFRTNKLNHLIQSDQSLCTVFAQLDAMGSGVNQPVGVERSLQGDNRIRYAGNNIDITTLAELLPIQVINSETFQILDGSPAIRRQFIDWGVFHADASFIRLWRGFRRVLKQRNSLLKYGKIDHRIRAVWDKEFIGHAEQLNTLRESYIDLLKPEFDKILNDLLDGMKLDLSFSSGWDKKRGLDQVLNDNFERDLKQGYTSAGPQRADLRLKIDGHTAAERLSRGQKKVVVSALKLAQGFLFYKLNSRSCIYLIDDLPSELDQQHSRLFCNYLEKAASQCFITCVDKTVLSEYWSSETEVSFFNLHEGALSTP